MVVQAIELRTQESRPSWATHPVATLYVSKSCLIQREGTRIEGEREEGEQEGRREEGGEEGRKTAVEDEGGGVISDKGIRQTKNWGGEHLSPFIVNLT